jgi:hypothetical protein
MKYLKQDKSYAIEMFENSSWCRAKHNDKNIALCMDQDTARQVIYRDIKENGGECDYLYDDDFEEGERR